MNDILGNALRLRNAGHRAGTACRSSPCTTSAARDFNDVVMDIADASTPLPLCHRNGIAPARSSSTPASASAGPPNRTSSHPPPAELWEFRLPLLVGTSRTSTIGFVLDAPVEERLEGTAATVTLAIAAGADIVRVHDVAEMAKVSKVTDAIVRGNWKYRAQQ